MNYSFSDKVSSLKPSAIREILKYTSLPGFIPFAAGNPAPEAFPTEEVAAITKDILEKNPVSALQYSITEGYTPLRDEIKKRLAFQHSFNESIDEVVITSGGQQANELSCKVFLNEGDCIICESPSFIGSLNSFRSYGVHLAGVDMDDDGMKLDELEKAIKSNRNVKIIYVIPNFQNPTGKCTSYERRKGIYALARKYDIIILEDNPYGELRFNGENIPSIKSLDTDGRVIYSGSFSKVVAPGLRVGFVSAPKEITQKIVVCKQVADVHTNILAQMICYRYITEYDFEKHLAELRVIYKKKCQLMLDNTDRYFSGSISVTRPDGGLFVWGTLPDGADMMDFCKKAVERKVAIVPGTAFITDENGTSNCFRMNYSTPSDEQIVSGCQIVGKLSREMFGE